MAGLTAQPEKPKKAAKVWEWPLQTGDGIVKVRDDFRTFEVALDASYFTSKEISVKVLGDMIEIRMEHEKEGEFGTVTRSVTRNYKLPERVDPASIRSELNRDGQLVIKGTKRFLH